MAAASARPVLGLKMFHTKLYELADQAGRKWLVVKNLNRVLAGTISRKFFIECLFAFHGRIKTDMFFISCEMDEVAIECKRRHSVLYCLLCFRTGFLYQSANLVHPGPDLGLAGSNVIINVLCVD